MKEERSIDNIWCDFSQNTGFHGLNKISSLSKGNKLRFGLWLCIILASATFLVYLIVREFQNYYEYPTMYSMYTQPDTQLEFPAVTICNLQTLNKSAIKNDSRITAYYFGKSRVSYKFKVNTNWSDPFYEQEGFFRNRTIEDILSENKKVLNNFVYYGQFDYQRLDISEHFKVVIYPTGPCFTTNPNKILKTSYTGSWFNLQLLLYLDHENDFYGSWFGEGVQFLIHDPGVDPSFDGASGHFAQPGQEVFAAVHKTQFEYLSKPFEAIPNTYCRETNDDGTLYVKSACLKDCYSRYMNDTCGCIHYTHDNNSYYCSKYSELTCVKLVNGNFIKILEMCDCPMECKSTHYDVRLTSSLYPADLYKEMVCGNDITHCRQNFVSLNIYFDKLTTTFVKQVPKFSTAGDILANFGGQMGLFLGASIVTVTELVEFVFLLMLCLYRRIRNNKTTTLQHTTKDG